MGENAKTREKKCPYCDSERVEGKGTAQGCGWGSGGFHDQWEQYKCLECLKAFRLVLNKACPDCGTMVYADNPVCANCHAKVQFAIPE